MSIAELRKILKDNDVKETSSDKEGLIYQATDVLLTNMAIQDMMEYDSIPIKKTKVSFSISLKVNSFIKLFLLSWSC